MCNIPYAIVDKYLSCPISAYGSDDLFFPGAVCTYWQETLVKVTKVVGTFMIMVNIKFAVDIIEPQCHI